MDPYQSTMIPAGVSEFGYAPNPEFLDPNFAPPAGLSTSSGLLNLPLQQTSAVGSGPNLSGSAQTPDFSLFGGVSQQLSPPSGFDAGVIGNRPLPFCVPNPNKGFSWVVVALLVPLVPLFIIKMANLIFPQTDCTAPNIANPALCLSENTAQKTFLYMTIFVLGIIGLVLAIAMNNARTVPRTAAMSIGIGSAASILYAIYSNYDKLNDSIQLVIIGLTILGVVMLPRYIRASM